MEIQVLLMGFLVCFGSTVDVNTNDQMSVNIQKNFRDLFDSMVKNDHQQSDTNRETLVRETVRERLAFGSMKSELQSARRKKAYLTQENSRRRRENTDENVVVPNAENNRHVNGAISDEPNAVKKLLMALGIKKDWVNLHPDERTLAFAQAAEKYWICREAFAFVDLRSRIIEFFGRLWFGLPQMKKESMHQVLLDKKIIPADSEKHLKAKAVAALSDTTPNPREEKREVMNFHAIQCLYILTEKEGDEIVDKIRAAIDKTEGLTKLKYCGEVGALYDRSSKVGGHPDCGSYSRAEIMASLKKMHEVFPYTETVVKTLYQEFD